MTEKEKLEWIRKTPLDIQYIENPSEKLQLEAIKLNYHSVLFLENMTEEMKMKAVKINPHAFQYMEKVSETVTREAIETYKKKYPNKDVDNIFDDQLLFYVYAQEKETFFKILPLYQKKLKYDRYFSVVCRYVNGNCEEWLKEFYKMMQPLTPEQQKVWNKYRLKTLL